MVIYCISNIPHEEFMALSRITEDRYRKVIGLYFNWKALNAGIKEDFTRGVNLPEAITEPICCYVNGFMHSLGEGSEDAVDPRTGSKVQIKATSNFWCDLTSFGPQSEFDELHFVRLNQEEDKMYLYYIPVNQLANVYVNAGETFADQQYQGRRPRFSIINKYILPDSIEPYAIVDLNTTEIERL